MSNVDHGFSIYGSSFSHNWNTLLGYETFKLKANCKPFQICSFPILCTFPACASLNHLVHTGSKLEVKVMHPDGHCRL